MCSKHGEKAHESLPISIINYLLLTRETANFDIIFICMLHKVVFHPKYTSGWNKKQGKKSRMKERNTKNSQLCVLQGKSQARPHQLQDHEWTAWIEIS